MKEKLLSILNKDVILLASIFMGIFVGLISQDIFSGVMMSILTYISIKLSEYNENKDQERLDKKYSDDPEWETYKKLKEKFKQ